MRILDQKLIYQRDIMIDTSNIEYVRKLKLKERIKKIKKIKNKIMNSPFWDLPNVHPLSAPSGKIFYLDFIYGDKLKERREKIEKIIERMNATIITNINKTSS